MISEGYSKQLTSHNACELRPSCCAWFAMQARSWKFESHFSEDLPLWEAVMFVAHCMLLLMKQWQNKAKRKSTRLWSFYEDDITEGQKGFQNYHLQGLPLPGLKDCWRSSSNPLIVAAWLGQVTPAPGLQDFFGALTCDIQAKWVFDETEIQIRFFQWRPATFKGASPVISIKIVVSYTVVPSQVAAPPGEFGFAKKQVPSHFYQGIIKFQTNQKRLVIACDMIIFQIQQISSLLWRSQYMTWYLANLAKHSDSLTPSELLRHHS